MLNKFVNSNSDEELLKSLADKELIDQEELSKAMNKAGLVQKEVQVKGKNGQTFMRKQWVKADEDVKQPKQPAKTESSPSLRGSNGKAIEFNRKDDTFKYNGSYSDNDMKIANNHSKNVERLGEKVISMIKDGKITSEEKASQAFSYGMSGNSSNGTFYEGFNQINNHHIWKDTLYGTKAKEEITAQMKYWMDKAKEEFNSKNSQATQKPNSIQGKTGEYKGIKYKIHTNNPFDKLNNEDNYSLAQKQIEKYGFCIEDETYKGKAPIAICVDSDYADVDGIVAEVTGKKKFEPKKDDPMKKWYDKLDSGNFSDEVKKELKYGLDKGAVALVTKDGKYKTAKTRDEYKYAREKGWEMVGSIVELIDAGKLPEKQASTTDDKKETKAQQDKESKLSPRCKRNLDVALQNKDDFEDVRSQYKSEIAKKTKEMKASGVSQLRRKTLKQEIGTLTSELDYISKKVEESDSDISKPDNKVAQPASTSNAKISKDEAKKKTQSLTSSIGKTDKERSDFMAKAKAQGITWKENDHVGINWMRCCMAMNKYFENGGSWKESSDNQDKKQDSNPTQANPKRVTGKSGEPYSIWIEGSRIKGSAVGKEDSRNARDIKDFTSSGFESVEEVEEYVKKYF